MEKGIVKSYDKYCGMGTINHASDSNVKFYIESVNGKERAGLTQGDSVMFEVYDIKNLHIAINVNKA